MAFTDLMRLVSKPPRANRECFGIFVDVGKLACNLAVERRISRGRRSAASERRVRRVGVRRREQVAHLVSREAVLILSKLVVKVIILVCGGGLCWVCKHV